MKKIKIFFQFKMIELNSIPKWLHKTERFLNYEKNSEDDDTIIIVPTNCLRTTNKNIEDFEDFINLYETVKYWDSEIPNSFEIFYLESDYKNKILGFLYYRKDNDYLANFLLENLNGYKIEGSIIDDFLDLNSVV